MYHRLITPAYIIFISIHSFAYLFYDINPFSLIYLYPYLLLIAVQIIWASFINSKEIGLKIFANFNSIFVLCSFVALMSYYNRVSVIVIMLLPLIHYFLVKMTIQYKLLNSHFEILNAFFFVVFFTSIILHPFYILTIDNTGAYFFLIILFLLSLIVYYLYSKVISKKFISYNNENKIVLLINSFFFSHVFLQILFVVPIFFTTISSDSKSNISYRLNYFCLNDINNDEFKRWAYICFIAGFYLLMLLIKFRNRKSQDTIKTNKQINY